MSEGQDSGGEGTTAGQEQSGAPSVQSVEVAAITLMGALVVGGYTLGSLNRDAFFLLKFDVEELPFMLISVALVSVPFLSLYSWVASKFPTGHLASGYFFLVALGYLVMGRIVLVDAPWSALIFYFYVTLAGVLSVSIFWLAVGARFYLRQAKKMMSLFGTGCVLGNLLGGAIGRWGAEHFGQNVLVSFAGVMFFGATLISLWVFRATEMAKAQGKKTPAGYLDGFRDLKESRLLRAIAVTLVASVVVATLADYQLQAIVKEKYPTQVELVQFFGTLYTILGAATLATQLFITDRVLSKFGMFGGLVSLPIAALPGAIALVAFPSIFCAVLLRGAENSARFSLFSSGYELAYLPVAEEKRKRAKPVVDVIFKRSAAGLAALLIIFLTEFANVGHRGLAIATLFAVQVLAWAVWKVRAAYIIDLQENLSAGSAHALEDAMKTGFYSVADTAFQQEHSGAWSTSIVFAPNLDSVDGKVGRTQTIYAPEMLSSSEPTRLQNDSIGSLFQNLDERKNLTHTLAAIHERGDIRFTGALLPLLAEERYRKRVMKIFKSHGASVAGLLADAALNEDESVTTRKAVIEQLGNLNVPLALSALKILLRSSNKHIRRSCSNALVEMRKSAETKILTTDELLRVLEIESADDDRFLKANADLHREEANDAEIASLRSAFYASLERRRRHLFRILSLRYDLQSIQAAFVALIGKDGRARDTATEYLDNVLHEKVKALAWPLIEAKAPASEPSAGQLVTPFDGQESSVDTNSQSPAPVLVGTSVPEELDVAVPVRTKPRTNARIRLASDFGGDAVEELPLPAFEAQITLGPSHDKTAETSAIKADPPVVDATIVGHANELFESARTQMRTLLESDEKKGAVTSSLQNASEAEATVFINTLLSADEQPTIHWANFESSDVNGAFIAETNAILINETLQNDESALQQTVMEEIGHWLEEELNSVDEAGDVRKTANPFLKDYK